MARRGLDEVRVSAKWLESLERPEVIEALQTGPIVAELTRRFAESRPASIVIGKAKIGAKDADAPIRSAGNTVASITGANFAFDRIWVPLDRIVAADVVVVRAFDGCASHCSVVGRSALALRAVRLDADGRPRGSEFAPVRRDGDVQVFDVPAGKYLLRSYGGEALDSGRRDSEPFEVLPDQTSEIDLTAWSTDLRRVAFSVRDRFGRPTAHYGIKFDSDKDFVGTVLGQVKGSDFAVWLPKKAYRLVLLDAMSERASALELAPDATEVRLKL